jgi:hypothetical protein
MKIGSFTINFAHVFASALFVVSIYLPKLLADSTFQSWLAANGHFGAAAAIILALFAQSIKPQPASVTSTTTITDTTPTLKPGGAGFVRVDLLAGFVLGVVIVLGIAACAAALPIAQGAIDVAGAVACVVQHETEPPLQIAQDCASFGLKTGGDVEKIIATMDKRAADRFTCVQASTLGDGGLGSKKPAQP